MDQRGSVEMKPCAGSSSAWQSRRGSISDWLVTIGLLGALALIVWVTRKDEKPPKQIKEIFCGEMDERGPGQNLCEYVMRSA
jgi:hypothetical protein